MFPTMQPEGRTPRPVPVSPLRGPRRWHLTPWKKTGLMDDITDTGTGGWDVFNNLITTAGNIWGKPNNTGIVAVPRPGQVVPYGSPTPIGSTSTGILGMSTNTLLLTGAAILGGVLLLKKMK